MHTIAQPSERKKLHLKLPEDADRFLRRQEVEDMVGLSYSRIYEMIRKGQFPRQARIGGAVRWSEIEIRQWQQDRLAERPSATSEEWTSIP